MQTSCRLTARSSSAEGMLYKVGQAFAAHLELACPLLCCLPISLHRDIPEKRTCNNRLSSLPINSSVACSLDRGAFRSQH